MLFSLTAGSRFSRRSILNFENVVQEKVQLLCDGIAKCKESGEVVTISDGFAAFSGDVVTQYVRALTCISR